MSIDIHPDCQRRLAERLAAILPEIRIHNGKCPIFVRALR
jgi:hypothetical protein